MTETTIEIRNNIKDEYGYLTASADIEELTFPTYRTRAQSIDAARKADGLGATIYRYQRRYFFDSSRHFGPSIDERLVEAGASPIGIVTKKGDFASFTGK